MFIPTSNNFIYVANNRGLLEIYGSDWRLFILQIIRHEAVVSIMILTNTGGYSEFGYWKPNESGVLFFTQSLLQN